MAKDITINIPGIKIAALQWGPSDGIPVLALHGWVDNAASFCFLAPHLQNANIVAIDSPGCGLSSHYGPEGFPSIVHEALHVTRIADELNWDKFVLLGHSRGASVAQLVASGCPQRVRSLILIDNVGFGATNILERWQHSVSATIKNKPRPATLYKDLDDSTKGRMQAGKIAYESAKALALRGSKAVEGGYIWTFDRREMLFVNPMPLGAEYGKQLLEGITCPTSIILAKDGILSKEKGEALSSPIPDKELTFIDGNHHVHMDDPQPVAKLINDFLKRRL